DHHHPRMHGTGSVYNSRLRSATGLRSPDRVIVYFKLCKEDCGRARHRPRRNNQSGRNLLRGSAGASPSRTSPNLKKSLTLDRPTPLADSHESEIVHAMRFGETASVIADNPISGNESSARRI